MKIQRVTANNRRRVFEVEFGGREWTFPYCRLEAVPSAANPIVELFIDPELGRTGFTFRLRDGSEDCVLTDQIRDYNDDPEYVRDLLLYRLTVEAQDRLKEATISKREIVRRLGTSASQLYRLLDQTNYKKSIGQVVQLLLILGCDVDFIVKPPRQKHAGYHVGGVA
jgi:hypothetical protein